ncbi:MAG: radical SAM protein [Actinomycetota bacterium]|nr:radical SAM protein [Actinomycetota bacterium]
MVSGSESRLRWRLVDEEPPGGQGALFNGDKLVERHIGTGEFRGMEFLHVNAQSIINEVPASSRMPFRYTINVYRGCSHACSYCFARPTHEYLGLDIGVDFERRIVVKINAVERLRAELAGRRWAGHAIAMGTNTDPYQRCEGKYHLTRGVIGLLTEAANPFSILTKSTLILRDLDLLVAAATQADVRVNFSIGSLDPKVWRLTEPGTPHPARRVDALRRLNQAGVPCGVLMAPILPGLSDHDNQLQDVVQACVGAGAVSITPLALHLRPGVKEHFLGQLAKDHPALAAAYQRKYRGAYLPAADQAALSEKVRTMIDQAGSRFRHPSAHLQPARTRPERHRATPAGADPETGPSLSQLALDLSGGS